MFLDNPWSHDINGYRVKSGDDTVIIPMVPLVVRRPAAIEWINRIADNQSGLSPNRLDIIDFSRARITIILIQGLYVFVRYLHGPIHIHYGIADTGIFLEFKCP